MSAVICKLEKREPLRFKLRGIVEEKNPHYVNLAATIVAKRKLFATDSLWLGGLLDVLHLRTRYIVHIAVTYGCMSDEHYSADGLRFDHVCTTPDGVHEYLRREKSRVRGDGVFRIYNCNSPELDELISDLYVKQEEEA